MRRAILAGDSANYAAVLAAAGLLRVSEPLVDEDLAAYIVVGGRRIAIYDVCLQTSTERIEITTVSDSYPVHMPGRKRLDVTFSCDEIIGITSDQVPFELRIGSAVLRGLMLLTAVMTKFAPIQSLVSAVGVGPTEIIPESVAQPHTDVTRSGRRAIRPSGLIG